MNKSFFLHYMNTAPTDAPERYIFITDNEEISQAIILAGFKSVYLAKEGSKYQYSIDTFLSYLDEIAYKGKYRTDYIYIPACSTKKANDTLEQYFKDEYLKAHPGWRLFKNKEYLSNFDKTEELKKTLEDFIKRFEGNSDDLPLDLMQFHLTDKRGVPIGVYDAAIENYIIANQKLFIYGGIPFLYRSGCYFPDWTKAELSTSIREKIFDNLVKSTTIDRVYRLFLTDARIQKNFDEINAYPAEWICFKNGMYDPISKKMMSHNEKYCCINQIPHEYHPESPPKEGEAIEKYLDFICDGKPDTREMLLQFMGYSLTRDTRQQKFLILTGEGGSGKSTLIKCFEMLVGQRNISNVSLTDLQQRFSSIELMGMLINSCADLEIGALTDTSMIKKLVGEDSIKGERKGKDLVFFKNYAKLIFSTNELPVIKAEKTNAFYRRLLVFPMSKVPEQKDPNLFHKLEAEKDYLLMLAIQALERMYQQENITIAAASEHEIERLRADSDTVEGFILEECEKVDGYRVERVELYKEYAAYCEESERQALTKNNFYKSLRLKNYSEITSNGKRYFLGLKTALKNCTNDGFMTVTQEQLEDLPFE